MRLYLPLSRFNIGLRGGKQVGMTLAGYTHPL